MRIMSPGSQCVFGGRRVIWRRDTNEHEAAEPPKSAPRGGMDELPQP
jgi:hypothetical protein